MDICFEKALFNANSAMKLAMSFTETFDFAYTYANTVLQPAFAIAVAVVQYQNMLYINARW